MMSDLSNAWKLDIAAAGSRISDKSLSPVALTEMMLDRIGKIDSKLLSYVTVLKNDALKSAANAEKEIAGGKYRGPLHGIPIAIKDIYDTKGVKTTACSKVRESYVPEEDCTVVRKFREAGAVILGKVTTHEFAFGFDFIRPKMPGISTIFLQVRAVVRVRRSQRVFALRLLEAIPAGRSARRRPRMVLLGSSRHMDA